MTRSRLAALTLGLLGLAGCAHGAGSRARATDPARRAGLLQERRANDVRFCPGRIAGADLVVEESPTGAVLELSSERAETVAEIRTRTRLPEGVATPVARGGGPRAVPCLELTGMEQPVRSAVTARPDGVRVVLEAGSQHDVDRIHAEVRRFVDGLLGLRTAPAGR
jgi:hypothetical protein